MLQWTLARLKLECAAAVSMPADDFKLWDLVANTDGRIDLDSYDQQETVQDAKLIFNQQLLVAKVPAMPHVQSARLPGGLPLTGRNLAAACRAKFALTLRLRPAICSCAPVTSSLPCRLKHS